MAVLSSSPARAVTLGTVLVAGRVTFDNDNAPTVVEGRGFTIARSAVSTYVITFAQKYPGVLFADVVLGLADANDIATDAPYKAVIVTTAAGAPVDLSARTLTFKILDSTGLLVLDAAELDTSGDGAGVSFLVAFRETSVPSV